MSDGAIPDLGTPSYKLAPLLLPTLRFDSIIYVAKLEHIMRMFSRASIYLENPTKDSL